MAVDKLSATRIKRLGNGKHSDGGGLYFFVRGDSRIWTYRYTDPVTKKRGERSLGSYPAVSLSAARKARDSARGAPQGDGDRTVANYVAKTFASLNGSLKRGGEAGNWMSPVNIHILPKLGGCDITTLTAGQIADAFAPVWHTTPTVARIAIDRLGIIMRYAEARLDAVDVRAVPKAVMLLGAQSHTPTNIPSLPWAEWPAYYATLGETPVELALRLLILTASRSAPVRLARLDQIDGNVWTVPAENMKTDAEFRVPLSDEALRVISLAVPYDGFLFVARQGRAISGSAMNKRLKQSGAAHRPHGFRSSFRTWAEETGEDWTLAETSLSHAIGNTVQRTYQRSDLLEQRRPLMQRWADHLLGAAGTV